MHLALAAKPALTAQSLHILLPAVTVADSYYKTIGG